MSQRQQAASYVGQQCCGLRKFSLGSVQDASATIKISVLLDRAIRLFFPGEKSGTPARRRDSFYDTQQISVRTNT